ncbi:hypothetical protein [Thalassovita aquimarina]|uniref:Uncharacterized protein n=1 Tax=Thalassovita aquimarina TaxID=2785917 RepID=A0ABS5HUS1_9RHOB|nr:hypothetical protein [Thalassovita aquimarina]MBR9652729.1 hypothetical protein [Thalassovita aquimarina]
MASTADDRIYSVTRIVSALIIPFLLLAFLILYFFPEESGQRFAYRINPPVMAAYIGAGYLGGAFLFLHVLFGKRWHHVAAGFPAVTAFTVSMLLVTILHWNRYSVDDLPFQLWLVLYLVTPVVVPLLWVFNRKADPGKAEENDAEVPLFVRTGVKILGITLAAMALVGFVAPEVLIAIWPWTLWPLTARLLAGWGMLLAASNIFISFEPRWSCWRIGVQSMALWHVLFLAAAIANPGDFKQHGLLNWYVIAVAIILVAMAILYAWMEKLRRRAP